MLGIALLTLLCGTITRAQNDGALDPAFGLNGTVSTNLGPTNDAAFALALQSDEKIVVAGLAGTSAIPFLNDFGVARYNSDGTLDTSFGMNGLAITPIGNGDDQARAVAIQPNDGKIIVAGSAWFGNAWDLALVRYLPNGTLDNSFGQNGRVTTSISTGHDLGFCVALQPDGKILVGGETNYQGLVQMLIVRYDQNGSIDTSFGQNGYAIINFGSANALAYGLIVQPDLNVLVGGYSGNNGSKDFALVRLLQNGLLDTSFGNGGGVLTSISTGDDLAHGMALHTDGRIVLCGSSQGQLNKDIALAQYTSSGQLDASFGSNGIFTFDGFGDDIAWGVTTQPDAKVLVTGSMVAGSTAHVLLRTNAVGDLDPNFGSDGVVITPGPQGASYGHALALSSLGPVFTCGGASNEAGADFFITKHSIGSMPEPPNAGENGALSICSSAMPVDLFDALQGTPDQGGSWTGPSPTSGLYDPVSMQSGVYTYTVSGEDLFPDATATVTVTETPMPFAGLDSNISLCGNESPILMRSMLPNAPSGGTWSGPSPTSGIYDPTTMDPGAYIYTVSGDGVCPDDQATLTINEQQAPNAGEDGIVEFCSNSPAASLMNYLGGSPHLNGVWFGPGWTPVSGAFNPGVSTEGVYSYLVPGTIPCPNDTAALLVSVLDLSITEIQGPTDVPEPGVLTYTIQPFLADADSIIWTFPEPWSWGNDADHSDGIAHISTGDTALIDFICATAFGGECAGEQVCLPINFTVGIPGVQQHEALAAYPNPSNGLFRIQINSSSRVQDLRVFDATGRQILVGVPELSMDELQLDLRGHAQGAYTVRVLLKDEWRVVPVLVGR